MFLFLASFMFYEGCNIDSQAYAVNITEKKNKFMTV